MAHGLGRQFSPGISVQPQPGVESGAQPFGIVQRQGDQRRGHIPRNSLENYPDLLRAVGRPVFGAEREDGVVGQDASGSHRDLLRRSVNGRRLRAGCEWATGRRFALGGQGGSGSRG